uniref:Sodium/calcium exchanger membrane region domain-containing protein n=1 Tax=Aureoumbra lagunensis TaxID=44058 RepID=A0A7S3NPV9_9STRA
MLTLSSKAANNASSAPELLVESTSVVDQTNTSEEEQEPASDRTINANRWKSRSVFAVFSCFILLAWLELEQYALVSRINQKDSRGKTFSGVEVDESKLRPIGIDRRPETRRWAKQYIRRHEGRFRLGHLVRMHAAGFHKVIGSSIFKKISAKIRYKKRRRHPRKIAKHVNKAEIKIQAKAAREIEIARAVAARKYYGILVYRIMAPIWTLALLVLATWMGLMLEERTLPAIKAICNAAEMNDDIAGATVLALATGGFEVLFSAVETLEGEVGVGLNFVLGAGIINFGLILPVISFSSPSPIIELELGPLIRDGGFALFAFFALLCVVADNTVSIFESLALLLLYMLHLFICYISSSRRTNHPTPKEFHSRLVEQPINNQSQENIPVIMRKESSWRNDHIPSPVVQKCTSNTTLISNTSYISEHPITKAALVLAHKLLPPAPKKFANVMTTKDTAPVSSVVFAVAPTLLGSAAWFVCLLLVLTRLADLLALSARLPLGFAASVFLPAIYAVPDVLVSATVARKGQARTAVANALGVQVVTVLLGVGLPFFLATARAHGRPVTVLGSQSDVSLRWSVFTLGSLFIFLVLLPPFRRVRNSIIRCFIPSSVVSSPRPFCTDTLSPCFTPLSAIFLFCVYLLVTVIVTIRTAV